MFLFLKTKSWFIQTPVCLYELIWWERHSRMGTLHTDSKGFWGHTKVWECAACAFIPKSFWKHRCCYKNEGSINWLCDIRTGNIALLYLHRPLLLRHICLCVLLITCVRCFILYGLSIHKKAEHVTGSQVNQTRALCCSHIRFLFLVFGNINLSSKGCKSNQRGISEHHWGPPRILSITFITYTLPLKRITQKCIFQFSKDALNWAKVTKRFIFQIKDVYFELYMNLKFILS